MPACYVKGCKNRTEFLKRHNPQEKVHFYAFPKDQQFVEKWREACGRANVNTKNAKVCSEHFAPSAFKEKTWLQTQLQFSPTRGRRLKDDSVPTEKLPHAKIEVAIKEGLSTSGEQNLNRADEAAANDGEIATESSAARKSTSAEQDLLIFEINCSRLQQETVLTENLVHTAASDDGNILFTINKNSPAILSEVFDKSKEELRDEKCAWKRKYEKLKRDNDVLHRKLRARERKIAKIERVVLKYAGVLKRLFTPGQINLLLHPEKSKTRWNAEDISAAMSLRNVSAKAYRFLRNSMQIPLPSFSTLKKWT